MRTPHLYLFIFLLTDLGGSSFLEFYKLKSQGPFWNAFFAVIATHFSQGLLRSEYRPTEYVCV